MSLLLSTAYAPLVEYMMQIYAHQGERIFIEAHEHIVKQSWRNRCDILTANGVQSLTIPIERPQGGKTLIKDIRISEHGAWRHVHEQAIRSSYGSSPYFEFYWDDIKPFYDKTYTYLWDYNIDLLLSLCRLMDIDVQLEETSDFIPLKGSDENFLDMRYSFHPSQLNRERDEALPYYQPFASRHGFVSQLSVLDLLMNMGPESLLYLHQSLQRL